jgi:ABC-2 type transport system ATP-binding protein
VNAPGPQTRVIDVTGLTKQYGNRRVVDGLTLHVERGEIYGFLGPNGSGKTTSIRMMCGLLTPDGGQGRTLGFDVVTEAARIKREVGYMTQRFGLYEDLSIRENLDFIGRMYSMPSRRERIDAALERLGLTARQDQLASALSGGWKQRLALAGCLLHEPKLLLLDEPTAGVDPQARREFWDEIHHLSDTGITVLVSTHYMDEAERCHRLGYIAEGKLLATGTPAELIANSGLATWIATGTGVNGALMEQLQALPEVALATRFGNALHVCGDDHAALAAALAPFMQTPGTAWREAETSLEDLFIRLMRKS